MERNRREGRVVMGASTISQQLAKNLFLSPDRTPWRKGQEAIITVMIERVMGKRRILELYLNVIEWGDGIFGAEAAARHYYGASAATLGPEAFGAPCRHGSPTRGTTIACAPPAGWCARRRSSSRACRPRELP